MKDQIQVIREFFDSISAPYEALIALEQLEAMAEQEPVHWRAVLDPEQVPQQVKTTMHVVGFREKKAAEGFVAEQIDFYGWRYTIEPLYAAPVAQQPQAEPRKADVARTCPFCNEEWVEQPQARPDFTDEWTGYLKDGETPFERFLRERKDMQSVLKLYQRVLEENERLKGQQPQAEAVQQKPKLIGWRTSDYLMETSDKDKADNWAVHNEILPIFEGDPYTKLVATPQQAEAVPNVCASFYTESAELIGTTEAPIKRVEREDDGTLHVYIDHWPQQAGRVSHQKTKQRSNHD